MNDTLSAGPLLNCSIIGNLTQVLCFRVAALKTLSAGNEIATAMINGWSIALLGQRNYRGEIISFDKIEVQNNDLKATVTLDEHNAPKEIVFENGTIVSFTYLQDKTVLVRSWRNNTIELSEIIPLRGY